MYESIYRSQILCTLISQRIYIFEEVLISEPYKAYMSPELKKNSSLNVLCTT